MKNLTPAERLVVAADFKPDAPVSAANARSQVRAKVLHFADSLADLKVCLKMNSVLRACGYSIIDEAKQRGLEVFGDLKLVDIKETLENDGRLLFGTGLSYLTAMTVAGVEGLSTLSKRVLGTHVLGVTALTSLTEQDVRRAHHASLEETVRDLAHIAGDAGLAGVVASAKEAPMLRRILGEASLIVTPGIRPKSLMVAGDDQNPDRIMTPAMALKAGADVLVIGRPITQAVNSREATKKVLEEIASVN